MAMFKRVVSEQLLFLCIVFAIGNIIHLGARGSDIHFLFITTLAAAALLLIAVWMLVNAVEAASLPPGAGAVAKAAAELKGIGSVATRWKRASLRGMLLLAVGLSAAAFFLAIAILEEGYPLADATRWPMAVVMMVILELVHGSLAVCKDWPSVYDPS